MYRMSESKISLAKNMKNNVMYIFSLYENYDSEKYEILKKLAIKDWLSGKKTIFFLFYRKIRIYGLLSQT